MRGFFLQRLVIAAVFGVAVFHALSATAFAQYNTAELSGIVRDAQGGVLPGATVVATHTPSGRKTTRVTDTAGRFLLPDLAVGPYVIVVELEGFKRFMQEDLVLAVGQRIDIPVVLQVGQFTEALTITAPAPLLQTQSADVSEIISNRQVVQLPLNGRQFLHLAQLTDGVAIPPGGTRGAALEQAGSLPAVYGQRSGHNIYLLDGVKVTDEYFNNLVISPSIDAIQEFKIEKSMYPAEFGGKSSALINVVTKSGGNAFHGSAPRVRTQRSFRCEELLRRSRTACASSAAAKLRRERWRPAEPRSVILLFQLRRSANESGADANVFGAVGGPPCW